MLSWQEQLKQAIFSPEALLKALNLEECADKLACLSPEQFPLRVTASFLSRMQKGNLHDPLLKQILPLAYENIETPNFSKDPLQESQDNPLPGLIHKYPSRVLLTVTGACAIHCRYCFRRHFPYSDNNPGLKGWDRVITYLENNPQISEVILSGGDPLAAPDSLLEQLAFKIAQVKHIKILRIHTRLPIVLPARICEDFLNWMQKIPLQKVVVVHCNHAQEINEEVAFALKKLKDAGITLLNQSVLLKEINDNADILANLSEKLFENGVLPYYLHLFDKVQNGAHFEVPFEQAQTIYQQLLTKLPGYLVPKMVREIPGKQSKTVLV